ncbi:probable adenylate kinase 7, mitochondrial isoform X2 [Mangifera indica]|uniref:probable adenylate kinase 7, mitochondrial isoform X2 n=1 Tax=Mangifera indica TaxID=29780 RepID=UPI001CF9302F|nr:probable adenylate kinase 7, mitochondrial isoform X2 [Mangifera indica]
MVGLTRPRAAALLLCQLCKTRAYGSSAAAQLQYDYYDEEYDLDGENSWMAPRIGSAESSPKRGVHWVLIGDPGVKKHVYAERLWKLLEVPHISMGSLVRQELNPRSSLYKQIANAVNEGKLVREDVIFALLSKRLEEGYYRGENGFILDGIPRTRIQAEILDQIVDIDLVVNFKCTEEHLVKKNLDGEAFSSRWEFLSTRSSRFSTVEATAAWNEKFRIYAGQETEETC